MAMMTERLRERFCKDNKYSIGIFKDPYFTNRLYILDQFYRDKAIYANYQMFVNMIVNNYATEQDYFEEYNKLKDTMMARIKETDAYQKFNTMDMNQFGVKSRDISSHDIFRPSNNGRYFVSIDMIKANFSSLSAYDPTIFDGAETWEDYIRQFTDVNHFINSKYIRQVILGNCNPKRHVTFEKYIMDQIIDDLIARMNYQNPAVYFSNDEIVFDITHKIKDGMLYDVSLDEFINSISVVINNVTYDKSVIKRFPIFKISLFQLFQIGNCGYAEKSLTDGSISLKSVNYYDTPIIMKKIMNQEITDMDLYFIHERKLCKFVDIPKVEVPEEICWK